MTLEGSEEIKNTECGWEGIEKDNPTRFFQRRKEGDALLPCF
jgi:hypothetical protein